MTDQSIPCAVDSRSDSAKILVLGCGVIGSIYAGRLAQSGCDVTMLARGRRLEELRAKGLLLQPYRSAEKPAHIPLQIVEQLAPNVSYDYVLVALRAEQASGALEILASTPSPCIISMVNHAGGYGEWEKAVGPGRLLAAFPGAGGYIRAGVVHYGLTSAWLQRTTLGELDGRITPRLTRLQSLLRRAGFPTALRRRMDAWQTTHLSVVCPLACALYHGGDGTVGLGATPPSATLMLAARALREALRFIHTSGIGITPARLHIVRLVPIRLVAFILRRMYSTQWAGTFVIPHALRARGEMLYLTDALRSLAHRHGQRLPHLEMLSATPLCRDQSERGDSAISPQG